jgi:ketosteroid isomerase-like protein
MDDAHDVVAAYWAAAEARDWATFGGLLAEDVVYEGRITDFWPTPYELPASRAHLVERY